MATLEELEKRIQKQEDIREIEKLQFMYWKTMDQQDWENYGKCFTEDFQFYCIETDSGANSGEEMVVRNQKLFSPATTSSHHGHQHWIEITSDTTAIGEWVLEDDLFDSEKNSEFVGRAYYTNEYEKVDGKWLCKKMLLSYTRAIGNTKKRLDKSGDALKVFFV